MLEALQIWRQYPRQIASDLSQFHNRRIADWHKGRRDKHGDLVLGSYELLEILEHMPDTGAFKTATRGGRQTRAERVLEELFNEIARLRASFHAVNGGEDAVYEPFILADPIDELEQEREGADAERDRARAVQALETELGWS